MTEHHDVDALVDDLNSLNLQYVSLKAELQRTRSVLTHLYDAVLEMAAPATAPKRGDRFEKHIDHLITSARPFIDETARSVRIGVVNNFNGRQLLLEVLPSGEFHIADRDAEWNTWSAGVWGWLS